MQSLVAMEADMKKVLKKIMALGTLTLMAFVGAAAWKPAENTGPAPQMVVLSPVASEPGDIGDGTSPEKRG